MNFSFSLKFIKFSCYLYCICCYIIAYAVLYIQATTVGIVSTIDNNSSLHRQARIVAKLLTFLLNYVYYIGEETFNTYQNGGSAHARFYDVTIKRFAGTLRKI